MKISKELNLINEVDGENGKIFVHSTPISTEVYDMYWKVLSRTFADIHSQGLAMVGGRVAGRLLRDVAESLGVWDGPHKDIQYVKTGLLAEIHRLTNVMSIGEKGYEMMPFGDAIKAGIIDAEDASEVEGTIVFFMASWHMYKRATRKQFLEQALSHWDARITSSPCTAFLTSLKTLTTPESTGNAVTS